MWKQLERFSYALALLSSVLFLYATVAYIDVRLPDRGVAETLLYLAAAGLWANAHTSLVYYRRRLKQLAPDQM